MPDPVSVESLATDIPNTWDGISLAAKQAGAKFPELVAAQWALESGWGKHESGKNNLFGLKGVGTVATTKEEVNGKMVTTEAAFLDFPSRLACVEYLVRLWYKDYKSYKGVNNAENVEDAAGRLVQANYATDSRYAQKLIGIIDGRKRAEAAKKSAAQASHLMTKTEWNTQVRALNLSQPDGSTCQAACIAMAVGTTDIRAIRNRLLQLGVPGSPATMGQVLRYYKGKRYIFDESASLNDMARYLKDGEFLITHGWFTSSGHVICLDGLKMAGQRMQFNVKDPWSEFDGPSWTYNKPSVQFYDGFYSEKLIFAACVAGNSRADAQTCYRSQPAALAFTAALALGQAWIHRILPG